MVRQAHAVDQPQCSKVGVPCEVMHALVFKTGEVGELQRSYERGLGKGPEGGRKGRGETPFDDEDTELWETYWVMAWLPSWRL